MISGITWSQYLAVAGLLSCLYYLALAGWFYRQEVKQLLTGKAGALPASPASTYQEGPAHYPSYEELKEVASQIRHGILAEAGKDASKQDLLARIHAVLAGYGGLRPPASRGALNHYIILQARELCGVEFSEEELEREWETQPRS